MLQTNGPDEFRHETLFLGGFEQFFQPLSTKQICQDVGTTWLDTLNFWG